MKDHERLSVSIQRQAPTNGRKPARVIDSYGQSRVDRRAILRLALPYMATSAIQMALNVIDMWFIGRISTDALAGVGAVQLLIIAVVFVIGGGVLSVQTIVAQSFGSLRYVRAAKAVWTALWATLCTAPLFVTVALSSHLILAPFGFKPQIERLASEFWLPRMAGLSLGIAGSAVLSFFYGIGRPGVTLVVTGIEVVVNALLNQLFIFRLHWGVAGSGWATTVAQAVGVLLALTVFLGTDCRRKYKSHLTWKPRLRLLWRQLLLGIPTGLLPAADLIGFSLFQMMQVRLGTVGGAVTQMIAVLGSIAYIPGFGIASAGTTLVGQSIGAGERPWAKRLGTCTILLTALCTGGIGVILALAGPWLLPLFVNSQDAESAAVVTLGTRLIWFAAAYQFFDGINLGSSMCLRGAGDSVVPVLLALPISCMIFLPLAHSLTFAPGMGWFDFLPQFGWGAIGGWSAVLVYGILLGGGLFLRWLSGDWFRIRV